MVGLCGEFPSGQLNRLIESDSYAEKVVTDLKQSKLIRTHYKDGLRGYRLTKRAKELLLSQNSCRFQNYLTGNAETNLIRSELPRRLRLHQKAETYLTLSHAGIPFFPDEKPLLFSESGEAATFPMRSLPLFYSSREIKNLGASTTKIKNSRSMGILMAPHCVYAVYNTGNTLLKWEYKTEVRLNAFLQHYLQGLPYHGPPTVYAIMTGSDMDMAFRLLTSTGGYKKTLFMLDTAYEHFYFLPNNSYGEYLLRLLVHPLVCFHTALTDFPYNLYGIFLCLVLFGLLTFLLMRMGYDRNGEISDHDRNLNYSTKGTYGTSGFMTPDEMMKVLELTGDVKKNKGTILGKLNGKAVCLPYQTRMNKNIAVYGASGSMKSRAFARNMIFQCVARGQEGNNASGESLIITDPKSELYESMSAYLENEGYVVKAFNLVNPENSDSWNCLGEINGQETMAQVFADVIIQNTGSGKGDHFWDNAEMNLLKALVLYVDQGFPPEARNIGQVYKLLTMSSEKELNSLFDLLPVSHPAKVPYCIYKQASDTVRSGVIIGLGARLQVFQNKLIRQITSYDEIDLTLPGKQKCAYFCITSDQDSTFDFLSSLFMTFIFIKLVRYADKYGEEGKLPVAVHILADELANTGAILELNKKISVIRSRNLSISCIFQNLPQMQNRYPYNQWQEIIGNCDTQLFLGCTDEVTATFISNRSGDVTVGVSSEAKQLNSWRVSDYTPEYRQTKSIGKRKLLTPDEILRLPLDTALVILRGQKVLKVEKYDYTLHPDAKKLTPRKASEHIPEWRKNGSSEETDYRPQPSFESAKRKRRSSSASIAKQKPHFTSEPVYQEPTPDDFMEDLLQENFIEDSPDSGMVPLDKDSIMS